MKKIIAFLLVTISCFALFAGCTNTNGSRKEGKGNWVRTTDSQEEINVSVVLTGIGEEWLTTVATAYEDETGIPVNVYFDGNMMSNITQAMNINKNLDDLYLTGSSYEWLKWVAQDKIHSLEDIVNVPYAGETNADGTPKTLADKIKKNVAPLGQYNDKQYIIQLTYAPTGMIYNEDILTSLGYDKFPETWAELLELCNDINAANLKNKNGKDVKPLSWGGAVYDLNDTYKALWAQSSIEKFEEFFANEDFEEPNSELFLDKGRLTALEALYDLLDPQNGFSKNSLEGLMGGTNVDSEIAFLNGLSVFCPTGGWFESEVSSALSNADFTYKFAPVPVVEGGEKIVNINIPTEFFLVPTASNNAEGAKDFLRFMFTEENLQLMHSINQTPLAFDYDTSKVKFTDWGKQVMDLIDNNKNIIAAAPNSHYRVGALAPRFISIEPFSLMATGVVKRNELTEKVLQPELAGRVKSWPDWTVMIDEMIAK